MKFQKELSQKIQQIKQSFQFNFDELFKVIGITRSTKFERFYSDDKLDKKYRSAASDILKDLGPISKEEVNYYENL